MTLSHAWLSQTGPQNLAIRKHWVTEIFYGGAVGGGKSDFLLGDFGQDVPRYGSAWRGILFRRTYPELEELISRSKDIYPQWMPGAEYREGDKTWLWPNGSTLKMRFLERPDDWRRYWGHQYTWIGWDELPTFKSLEPYHRMKARLRSAQGVPNMRIRSTGNPGGPAHQEVKAYFQIDRHRDGNVLITDEQSGMTRMFIKSRVTDNKILLENDPGYVNRLYSIGSKELVQALRDGDWDVVAGAFFDCWDTRRHVIKPFRVPKEWLRFRSMDWGSARPFSVGWWAVVPDWTQTADGHWLPRGALVRYREWYGCMEGQPNTGLKMTAEAVGQGILDRDGTDTIAYGVLDPAGFAQDGGPSIAERMRMLPDESGAARPIGPIFRRADNKRVSVRGALGGWDMMRHRLIGLDYGDPFGQRPMLYVFDTCNDFIRTVPVLQHDDTHPEDVDTDGEDHVGDEARYACMSRPWIPKPAEDTAPRSIVIGGRSTETFNDLLGVVKRRGERL